MTRPPPVFRLYLPGYRIALSAALAVMFGLRTLTSLSGTSSLPGPAWAIAQGTICVLSILRCFDRVTVTHRGITIYRLGIGRTIAPTVIHQLAVTPGKNRRWARCYAVTTDGRQVLLTAEKNDPGGNARLRQLWDQTHWMLGAQFQRTG